MKRHLKTLFIGALTIGLMGFFLRNADLGRVWAAVRSARGDLLLLSLILTAVSYALRIERWRYLLKPLGHASFNSAGRATTIGFAANALLPGRVGEVLRPYILARREAMSGSAAFATIVLERLLDLGTIVLLVALFLAFFDLPTEDHALEELIQAGAMASATFVAAGVGLIIVLASNPERAARAARQCGKLAPARLRPAVTAGLERFFVGLAVVKRPAFLVLAMVLSLILWASVAWSMWAAAAAFGIAVSFSGAIVLMGLVALGVAVPTPAGVGGYHAAFQFGATALYGASGDQAVGAALVMHMISFGPVTVLGLFFMAQEGLQLGSLSTMVTQGDEGSAG